MIIRLSAKLGKKIHDVPAESLPVDPNPYADWSAHLFTADRVQYILVSNTASFFSFVMYGRGISDSGLFLKRTISTMSEFLADNGFGSLFEESISPSTALVSFSKALNRSVTGSMNELVYMAKLNLIEREMSPYDVSFKLNDTIVSLSGGYDYPYRAFPGLAGETSRAIPPEEQTAGKARGGPGVNFTPEATRRWEELEPSSRLLILNNVICVSCRGGVSMQLLEGKMERGDLILKGRCIRCGGEVARVVEGA